MLNSMALEPAPARRSVRPKTHNAGLLSLASELAKCAIWEHEHGSDHRAIRASFWVDIDTQENQERLLIKNANWDKIREDMERQKETGFPTENVDEMVDCLNRWVNKALEA